MGFNLLGTKNGRLIGADKARIAAMSAAETTRDILAVQRQFEKLRTGEGFDRASFINTCDTIDITNVDDIPKAFAMLAYVADNMVGITTVSINMILSVANQVSQFLDADGKPSLNKIRKVFRYFGEDAEEGTKYSSIFVKGYNKDYALDRFNRVTSFHHVSILEIEEYDQRIRKVDVATLTELDLVNIAKDFDFIGRAMQELSIDATKDKDKDLGYDVTHFANTLSKSLGQLIAKGDKKRPTGEKAIKNNLFSILRKVEKGEKAEAYDMWLNTSRKSLAEADENDMEEINDAYIIDNAGENCMAIKDGYNKSMEKVIKSLYSCNTNKYVNVCAKWLEEELVSPKASDEEKEAMELKNRNKILFVKHCTIALQTLNYFFKEKSEGGLNGASLTEKALSLRDGLYNLGAHLGFKKEEVIEAAIAASFVWKFDGVRPLVSAIPNFRSTWRMFSREFIFWYTGNELEISLEPKRIKGIGLAAGDELDFVDGTAVYEICDKVGSVTVTQNYTGPAIVTEEGCIVALVDIYEYNEKRVIVLDNLYKANSALATVPKKENVELADSDFTLISTLTISNLIRKDKKTKAVNLTTANGIERTIVSQIGVDPSGKPIISRVGDFIDMTFVASKSNVFFVNEVVISPFGGFLFV